MQEKELCNHFLLRFAPCLTAIYDTIQLIPIRTVEGFDTHLSPKLSVINVPAIFDNWITVEPRLDSLHKTSPVPPLADTSDDGERTRITKRNKPKISEKRRHKKYLPETQTRPTTNADEAENEETPENWAGQKVTEAGGGAVNVVKENTGMNK
ncbi:hypothetical protein EUTSA_v10015857mg [Eutrema salsugineum]|uniref:Uncharacterized protein n=1 Tax=Eutrema salsugineum TaxID=72664 RepID=V4KUF8_EUTSA|nr:hypothetical protein EUTSA_v10015857mg [Eutrema salsugineum]